MDTEESNRNEENRMFAIRALYKDAALIARCDAAPDHLLVMFPKEKGPQVARILIAFENYYGESIENFENTVDHTGFWLPRAVTKQGKDGQAVTGTTLESHYLEQCGIQGQIAYIAHSKDLEDLTDQLLSHTHIAPIISQGWGLN